MKLSNILLTEAKLHHSVWTDPDFNGPELPFEITSKSLRLPDNWESGRNSTRPSPISRLDPIYLPDRFLYRGENDRISKTSMFDKIVSKIKQNGAVKVFAKPGKLINVDNNGLEPLPNEIAKAYGNNRFENAPDIWIVSKVEESELAEKPRKRNDSRDLSLVDPNSATYENLMAVGEGDRPFQVVGLSSRNLAYEVAQTYDLILKVFGSNFVLMGKDTNEDDLRKLLQIQHSKSV